jgi:hypothetical protein
MSLNRTVCSDQRLSSKILAETQSSAICRSALRSTLNKSIFPMPVRFSERHGHSSSTAATITIRNDAPHNFRGVLVDIGYECGFRPNTLRPLVCKILRKRADDDNWSEYPNIDSEIRRLIDEADWYRVYDIVEAMACTIESGNIGGDSSRFESELNDFFASSGIGWKLRGTVLEARGSDALETALRSANEGLVCAGMSTAQSELHEALRDLARRPNADTTGAIQHSMAALECVARQACGNEKATLGEIIKRYKDLIPKPLDEAVMKLWGFASENARHLSEGRMPSYEEAELLVGVVASVSSYLSKRADA